MELLSGVIVALLGILGLLFLIGKRAIDRQDQKEEERVRRRMKHLQASERRERAQTERIVDNLTDSGQRDRVRGKYVRKGRSGGEAVPRADVSVSETDNVQSARHSGNDRTDN